MNGIVKHLMWGIVALIGASCLGVIALRQGEQISALWIVVAAMSVCAGILNAASMSY